MHNDKKKHKKRKQSPIKQNACVQATQQLNATKSQLHPASRMCH
jgi:hypothetical protein